MIRYTTPTITLTIKKILPLGAKAIVSLRQKNTQLDKEVAYDNDTKQTTLVVELTQAESAKFASGEPVLVQVNWITPDGERDATKVASVVAFENLLDKVIAYA